MILKLDGLQTAVPKRFSPLTAPQSFSLFILGGTGGFQADFDGGLQVLFGTSLVLQVLGPTGGLRNLVTFFNIAAEGVAHREVEYVQVLAEMTQDLRLVRQTHLVA